jgi:hypothetical protein
LQWLAKLLSSNSASRSGSTLRKGHSAPTPTAGHPPNFRTESPGHGACLSFGSLKTEEKTERQCGQYAPTLGWSRNCLSISLSATLPAATRLTVDSHFVQRIDNTARTHRPHESFPTRMVRSLTIVAGSNPHFGEWTVGHVFVGEFDPGSG